MTILSALTRLYERMIETGTAPKPGFTAEKISYELIIDKQGTPVDLSPLEKSTDKKPGPCIRSVPKAVKRASNITPNLLWDKTAYVLGVTAIKSQAASIVAGQGKRTLDEHKAFVDAHLKLLADTKDDGLLALRAFLQKWQPEQFVALGFPLDALDKNIVFRLDGDDQGGTPRLLHERPAVLPLLQTSQAQKTGLCLVTGKDRVIARLHPSIKGVMGAKSSGAALVSFNEAAYTSFGKSQGQNAPVSEYAAHAYGVALNELLAKESQQNMRIGDTTMVFWAQADTSQQAAAGDMLMGWALNPAKERDENHKLHASLKDIAEGRFAKAPEFDADTKVFLLGLAPNAARLSIRFWHQGSLGEFATNIAQFWKDLALEPSGFKGPPMAWALLYETAVRHKAENIPPLLGGQLMRAVLTGKPLPRTLLAAVLIRIRADHDINARRIAICKAVINRTTTEEISVSLDRESTNPAYRLGRLFALLEKAQCAALPKLKTTIKDRYFATACATPARIFALLTRTATHHLANLKKGENSNLGHWLEKEIGEVWSGIDKELPRSLTLEDQGRFCAGYYHQRWAKNSKPTTPSDKEEVENV